MAMYPHYSNESNDRGLSVGSEDKEVRVRFLHARKINGLS